MPFVSVVPAIRTPFGVDVFDYRVTEGSKLVPGDLVRVPFRRRILPALVVACAAESPYADRAVSITGDPILRLGGSVVPLLASTAKRSFSSQPTVFTSWIRHVPVRTILAHERPLSSNASLRQQKTIYTAARIPSVIEQAKLATGRVLILTPWQHRADLVAKHLGSAVLHADLADGAAWKACASFIGNTTSTLVTTRIGAWLSCIADTVIIDEPENDDHKQDELSPRIDARWLVDEAARIRTDLSVIKIGTTPMLSSWVDRRDPGSLSSASWRIVRDDNKIEIPTLNVELTTEQWQRGSRSPIAGLSSAAVEQLEVALEENKLVVIVHPVHGDRSRIHCRDCRWTMMCPNCGFQLTAEMTNARCHRCGQTSNLLNECPSCGGADLSAARVGKDRVALQIQQAYGDRVRVADLPEWHRLSLSKGALVIVSDISLIGGYVEDIRRRERFVIAWRRIAAAVAQAEGKLYALGPETALADARSFLEAGGVASTWDAEWKEREAFQYPPTHPRIKLIVDGGLEEGATAVDVATKVLPPDWTVEGPYLVAYRSKTRKSRTILHLLPPKGSNLDQEFSLLEPLAKAGIIDLDPIAFFS
ncbi:MAG: hypothetical protein ABIO72_06070 [Patescibacteria group bacterium]